MDDLSRLRVETRPAGGAVVAAAGAPVSPLSGAAAVTADGAGVGHSARFPASRTKLDTLFLQWLSLPESQKLVREREREREGGMIF